MAIVLTSENVNKDFGISCAQENFYKPLCLDGYLTPLQRKKLREKRNCHSVDISDSEKLIDLKKSRPCKQKKERLLGMFAKSKKKFKGKRSRENTAQVTYPVAKIILRTVNVDDNSKKFFKAPSKNRLDKANFTMPFSYNKNTFSNIKKYVTDTLCYSRKQLPNKENSIYSSDIIQNAKLSDVPLDSAKNSSSSSKCVLPEESKESEIHETSEGFNDDASNAPIEKSVFDFDWPEDNLLLERQEKARAIVRMQRIEDPQKAYKESSVNGILRDDLFSFLTFCV